MSLFVNAGVGDFRPLDQFDEAGFDRSFAINLKGPYFLIQALLPIARKSRLDRTQHVDQRPYRHAELDDLCGNQGGAAVARQDAVGRTDRPRRPRQRGQSLARSRPRCTERSAWTPRRSKG
jgi:NAD(P)-dependent dehydrogenase (short-subunit alcohol dehydrogenase family)